MRGLRRHLYLLLAALLVALAPPAGAQSPGTFPDITPAKCGQTGEAVEVPSFADSRDVDGCLLVPSGTTLGNIPFMFSQFHKPTAIGGQCNAATLTGDPWFNTNVDNINFGGSRCSESADTGNSKSCTVLIWDVFVDGYRDIACRNADLFQWSKEHAWSWIYIKDSTIANSFKCKNSFSNPSTGGECASCPKDWTPVGGLAPASTQCFAGDNSGSHVDGIQNKGSPALNGWFIMQDVVFVNGFNNHFLDQDPPLAGVGAPIGNMMFQGAKMGRQDAIGLATDWPEDCKVFGGNTGGTGICETGAMSSSRDHPEWWLIEVWGTALWNLFGNNEKIVIVNTGCAATDDAECGGTIGYNNGWPHPLLGKGTGTSTCPNGLLLQDATNACGTGTHDSCFCYTSMEEARDDVSTGAAAGEGDCPATWCPHIMPPFVTLSSSGWEGSSPSVTFEGGVLSEGSRDCDLHAHDCDPLWP